MRKWEFGSGKSEFGSGNLEVGIRNGEVGRLKDRRCEGEKVRSWEGGKTKKKIEK
jgi:hypothetical protein